jgi:hypothetical protein
MEDLYNLLCRPTNDLEGCSSESPLPTYFDPVSVETRLSEGPDRHLYELYCEHFINFFPKTPYYVRNTYAPKPETPYAGWFEKKSRNRRQRLALIDKDDWTNKTDCVEQHLDYERWCRFKQATVQDWAYKPREFFWLGMVKPKAVCFNAIDFDNKRFLGYYVDREDGVGRVHPVMQMPLDHFKEMKRIYDVFPNRIWCITSETLGLDIIERHNLTMADLIHELVKDRLGRIGLGATEVHPMQGRCKRRPFGRHYRTIVEGGLIEQWQGQLRHYMSPSSPPSFESIFEVLGTQLIRQWRRWRENGDVFHRDLDVEPAIKWAVAELERTRRWIEDGCDLSNGVSVSVLEVVPDDTVTQETASAPETPERKVERPQAVCIVPSGFPGMRDGNWAKDLERIAREGLPCDDRLGEICFEMAKYLWWVELYHLPESERASEINRLLRTFVAEKNNGFVTRWSAGQFEDVFDQLHRCVQRARRIGEREGEDWSLGLFQAIREKQASGQYRKVIRLAPLLEGSAGLQRVGEGGTTSSSSSLTSIYITVGTLESLDEALPALVVERIDKVRGRSKVIPYATRLLNCLKTSSGTVYISHDRLCEFLGYTDRVRTSDYNEILQRAGLITKTHYVRNKRPCGYQLTEDARRLFENGGLD